MFSRQSSRTNEQLTLMQRDVDEIKVAVKDVQTILSGSGGTPGLLVNFATFCQKVSGIETILNNDIAHLSAKMDTMFTSQQIVSEQRLQNEANLKAKEDANTVTWSDLLKDWIKPIVVTVLTAILTYFIVTSGIAR